MERYLEKISLWWNSKGSSEAQNIWRKIRNVARRGERALIRISRRIVRLMVIGFIINIVTNYFYPEFSTRFPVIYSWFDGWLQLGEFAVKGGIKLVYSVFTGNFSSFYSSYTAEYHEMVQRFISWLANI